MGTFMVRPYEEKKKELHYAIHVMSQNEEVKHYLVQCIVGKPVKVNKKDISDVDKPRGITQVIIRLRNPVGTPLADGPALGESLPAPGYIDENEGWLHTDMSGKGKNKATGKKYNAEAAGESVVCTLFILKEKKSRRGNRVNIPPALCVLAAIRGTFHREIPPDLQNQQCLARMAYRAGV